MGLVAALTFNDVIKDGHTLLIKDLSSNALHARYYGVGDTLTNLSQHLHTSTVQRVHREAKHLQESNIRQVALPGLKPIPWTIHSHHYFSLVEKIDTGVEHKLMKVQGFKEAVRTILLLVVRGRNQDLGGEPYFHLLPMELLFCIFSSLAE